LEERRLIAHQESLGGDFRKTTKDQIYEDRAIAKKRRDVNNQHHTRYEMEQDKSRAETMRKHGLPADGSVPVLSSPGGSTLKF
jgi:hypothetical protein